MGSRHEQKLVCDDRLDVARRLYHALCAQYPDRFITLFDATVHVSQLIASAGSACCRTSDPRCTHLRRYVTIQRLGAPERHRADRLAATPRSAVSHRG